MDDDKSLLEHKRGLQTKLTESVTVERARRRKTLDYVTGDADAHCPAWCLDLGALLVGVVSMFLHAAVSSNLRVLVSMLLCCLVLCCVVFGVFFHSRGG